MQISTTSKERIFDMAEQLFNARGYSAVSMRDIADSLDMRQASLYYHVPEGKEQLYVEVTQRNLLRHEAGISKAVNSTSGKNIQARLWALADWFAANAPLRLMSMLETDIASLSTERAQYLTKLAHRALFVPMAAFFAGAQERGEIREKDPARLASYFLALMDGISYRRASELLDTEMDVLVRDALDVFLNGLWRLEPTNQEQRPQAS